MRKIKILIADDEVDLREILEMILESSYDCQIIQAENGQVAEDLLNSGESFDLIISDYRMPIKNGSDLYLANKNLNNIPFILASGGSLSEYPTMKDFYQSNPANFFLEKPYKEDDLIKAVTKIASEIRGQKTLEHSPISPLVRIRLDHFIKYAKDASEAYIQIGPEKFVKISEENPNTQNGNELLQHYVNKKIDYIYIRTSFLKKIIAEHRTTIANYKSPEDKIQLAGFVFNISLSALKAISIDEIELENINTIIEDTLNELLKDKNIYPLIKDLLGKEGFLIGHSFFSIYIAASILRETSFIFSKTLKKITMAALLHDISLGNLDICSLEMQENNLTQVKSNFALFNHPIESAKILVEKNDFFEEVKKIIIEHHEKPDGNGYPKGLNANSISPLSALFILSHDIAIYLIKNEYHSDLLNSFLKNKRDYYSKGNFTKFYLMALKD
jgi:response regulator RpfG family c-di-GMP phosphodiesterase